MNSCKWCNQNFDISNKPKGWMANHSRWCNDNPKRIEYANKIAESRRTWTAETKKHHSELIKKHHVSGSYDNAKKKQKINPSFKGKFHSDKTKDIIKQKALNSKHRRLKKNMHVYNGILMDSTWEVILANRLDTLNIIWERPSPLKWIDDLGIQHNYFPDFYLPKYDMYLDPKNPYAYKVQLKKINILKQLYNNVYFLSSIDECKTFIIENYIK